MENNETERALAAFGEAAPLDIHKTEPFNAIVRANLRINRPQDAYVAQLKAIKRNPDQPSQYILLSSILDDLHRPEEAKEALRHAEELAKSARAASAS